MTSIVDLDVDHLTGIISLPPERYRASPSPKVLSGLQPIRFSRAMTLEATITVVTPTGRLSENNFVGGLDLKRLRFVLLAA